MMWVMVVLPLVMLGLGFPIVLLLLTTCAVMLLVFTPVPTTVAHQVMFDSMNKFALLSVPFFIFTGDLMSRGGISNRLLRWVTSFVGSIRGSLPLTSLGMAAVFGAISGATTATVATIGSVTYRRMREAGYSEKFASGLITAEGALDNLIPPSIGFILYGVASNTSIVELFAAGIGPGIVLGVFFGAYIVWHAWSRDVRESEGFRWSEVVASTIDGFWALLAPVIILGGIYSGLFSPTEAAGVACIYAIIVTVFIYREVTFIELFHIASRSMYTTAIVFIIVAAAGLYAWILTISGVAQTAVDFVGGLNAPKWAVLLAINILLLFVGCFLDTVSALLVLTPLMLPISKALEVDPIHFGVIVVMNLTIGTFTPPFGLNIFVFQAMFRTPSRVLYPGLLPFIVLAIAALLVVTYVPPISLWILRFL